MKKTVKFILVFAALVAFCAGAFSLVFGRSIRNTPTDFE